MIDNKPSIYNAQSVYNQGGASGTFDIDIGGVSQTLVFPPYLVPVEYIDASNFNGTNFSLLFGAPFERTLDDVLKMRIGFNGLTSGYVFEFNQAWGYNGTSPNSTFFITNTGVRIAYGAVNPAISTANLDTSRLDILFRYTDRFIKVTDVNGASETNNTDTHTKYTSKQGRCSVFGANASSAVNTFKGKFYFAHITVNNVIKMILVPAKSKIDGSPFVVECVSGAVGGNCTSDFDFSSIAFGPELDLSSLQQYFE